MLNGLLLFEQGSLLAIIITTPRGSGFPRACPNKPLLFENHLQISTHQAKPEPRARLGISAPKHRDHERTLFFPPKGVDVLSEQTTYPCNSSLLDELTVLI